jgi:hypothetical protein
MTYCHPFYLVIWNKSGIFRVVVGGSVRIEMKINEKKFPFYLDISAFFRILVL